MRKRSNREQWIQLLAEKEQSGETAKAFCDARGLGEHQYYYWRRALSAKSQIKDEGFVELHVQDGDSGVRVDLKTLTVQLDAGFDESVLGQVLRLVGGC